MSLIRDNLSNIINDAKEGTLKAIALIAPQRNHQAPAVPTSAEQGYPAIDAGIWYSCVAPAGTPHELIETLHAEIAKILKRPDVESRLSGLADRRRGSSRGICGLPEIRHGALEAGDRGGGY